MMRAVIVAIAVEVIGGLTVALIMKGHA
jgi:hypothetical protein